MRLCNKHCAQCVKHGPYERCDRCAGAAFDPETDFMFCKMEADTSGCKLWDINLVSEKATCLDCPSTKLSGSEDRCIT